MGVLLDVYSVFQTNALLQTRFPYRFNLAPSRCFKLYHLQVTLPIGSLLPHQTSHYGKSSKKYKVWKLKGLLQFIYLGSLPSFLLKLLQTGNLHFSYQSIPNSFFLYPKLINNNDFECYYIRIWLHSVFASIHN